MRLSWDELDEQGCADHGAPDWNSMTVVGPTKVRDARGNVTLQWSVTVHCQPALPAATPLPVPAAPPAGDPQPVVGLPAPVAAVA